MPDFLLFRLYGAMAAWGEVAVGERRASLGHPGKSAVTGLLAGALGVRRADVQKLTALHIGCGMAVRYWPARAHLIDYHTAQTPLRNKNGYDSRAEELSGDKLNTVLSSREYLLDALADIAVWIKSEGPYSLSDMAQALTAPQFIPYLGRKSCPTALPFQPQLLTAEGFYEAFKLADQTWGQGFSAFSLTLPQGAPRLAWEEGAPGKVPEAQLKQHRRDHCVRPQARLFTERFEFHGVATD